MKKFQFRLETLRKYREFIERQKQLEVARARFEVLSCEEAIETARAAHSQTAGSLEADLENGVDAARFMQIRNYMAGLEALEASEEKRRIGLLKELTRRQKELARKSVEKKAIERLKERQKEAYYGAMQKEEQKEMDDTMILRQARSQDI
jgi:flagellar FliJ protein